MYAVTATVTKDGIMRQVPTFYLNENVQGIVSAEHAEQIATEVINSTGDPEMKVSICVQSVSPV